MVEIQTMQPIPNGDLPQWRDASGQSLDPTRCCLTVTTSKPAATLVELVKWLDERGLELTDVHLKRPTLEDAFIELTGKSLRD